MSIGSTMNGAVRPVFSGQTADFVAPQTPISLIVDLQTTQGNCFFLWNDDNLRCIAVGIAQVASSTTPGRVPPKTGKIFYKGSQQTFTVQAVGPGAGSAVGFAYPCDLLF